MRESWIDEFESVFEHASIPVFDLPQVQIERIALVVAGDGDDTPVREVTSHIEKRFQCETHLFCAGPAAGSKAVEGAQAFEDVHALVRHLEGKAYQLIVLARNQHFEADTLDTLVKEAEAPVLVVPPALERPEAMFKNVLHAMAGSLERINHLAYSFTLTEDKGRLMLLHTVEAHEVDDVRDTLRASPDISAETGDALIEELKHHAERYLKGVVASARSEPFEVAYHLRVGSVLRTVQAELASGAFGLLIVGSHADAKSNITSAEYQLMHEIRSIPVLAL